MRAAGLPRWDTEVIRDYLPGSRDWRVCVERVLVGTIPGGGKRQTGQRRKRLRAGFLHDCSAMVLHSALADAEFRGDVLIGMAGEDQFHDLARSRSEARDAVRRSLPPGEQLVRIPRLFESSLDAGDQFGGADRLLDEVRSARLHGLNCHRHVGIAGDHDGRQTMARIMEPLQQFEAAHPG